MRYQRSFRQLAGKLALLLTIGAFVSTLAAAEPAYIGAWSNGRGESLTITATTIQFEADKPVRYRDFTKVTDGKIFNLQLTAPGDVNGFSGKFLALRLADDEMRIVCFNSAADLLHDENSGCDVTWFKEQSSD